MRWPCPRCVKTIEISLNSRADSVSCPYCGARYALVELERLSNRRDRLKRLTGYEIGQYLGSGEFADVFQAVDESSGQAVAIKIPRTDSLEQRTFLQREVKATARLQHPNIVRVHKLLREADRTFIVCDLVRGQALDAWAKQNPLTPQQAADLVAQLADAMQHAHSQAVVHRDLKPSNIIITADGQPHITDFGLALCESDPTLMSHERHQQALLLLTHRIRDARKAAIFGTPAYMAPEQARGDPATALSDVYALGAILYELLTGTAPFHGDVHSVLRKVARERPVPPRKIRTVVFRAIWRTSASKPWPNGLRGVTPPQEP